MPRPEAPAEPFVNGNVVHGFREAALDLWGKAGLDEIAARLPPDARTETIDSIVLPVSWYPVRFSTAWHQAIWEGPARRDAAELARFVARSVDMGFGRFKRTLLSFATPEMLLSRAPELWRYQHTHGTLEGAWEGDGGARMTLRDHPYVTHPVSARLQANALAHIASLGFRARPARESHAVEAGALVIRLTWR
jgi:hypothetical protein